MATDLYSGLTLSVRQVHESSIEDDGQGGKITVELPGFLELYVTLDGAPVVVQRFKAPGILADIARAKAAAGSSPTSGDTQPSPDQ